MAKTFTATAHQGETLDGLIWRILGADATALGAVMVLNRGLAQLGAILPEGTQVTLPSPVDTPTRTLETVKLWD